MITTTEQFSHKKDRGFTLVEIIISLGLLVIIIGAGLSAVTQIGWSSTSLTQYSEINRDSRHTLATLGNDLRLAHKIDDATTSLLDIWVYGKDRESINVRYDYDSEEDELIRTVGANSRVLLTDLTSFEFAYYNFLGETTSKPISIKEIKVSGTVYRKFLHFEASNNLVSAKYMLRNHHVTD